MSLNRPKNKFGTLTKIKRTELFNRDFELINHVKGSLRKSMMVRPIGEVHMQTYANETGNFYTETRI